MTEPTKITTEEERETMIAWCVLFTGFNRVYFENMTMPELLAEFKERQAKSQ